MFETGYFLKTRAFWQRGMPDTWHEQRPGKCTQPPRLKPYKPGPRGMWFCHHLIRRADGEPAGFEAIAYRNQRRRKLKGNGPRDGIRRAPQPPEESEPIPVPAPSADDWDEDHALSQVEGDLLEELEDL